MKKLNKIWVEKLEPLLMKDFIFKGWQIVIFAVVLALAKILFF